MTLDAANGIDLSVVGDRRWNIDIATIGIIVLILERDLHLVITTIVVIDAAFFKVIGHD